MGHLDGRRKGLRRRSGSLSSVVERVCFARAGSVYSIHPVAPLTFVSQAGSLVTRRVLVADATFKRPKDFWTPEEHPVHHQNGVPVPDIDDFYPEQPEDTTRTNFCFLTAAAPQQVVYTDQTGRLPQLTLEWDYEKGQVRISIKLKRS
jgi:hypothetical protein